VHESMGIWYGQVYPRERVLYGEAFHHWRQNTATNVLGISSSGGVMSPAKAARWKAVSSGIVMWRGERGGSLGFYSPQGFSWRRVDRWASLAARTGKPYWTVAERVGLWLPVSAVLACRLH